MASPSPRQDSVSSVDTFLLSKGSILNVAFISAKTRRPAFVTHTKSGTTTVYRIDHNANVVPFGSILWTGFEGTVSSVSSISTEPCVVFPASESRSQSFIVPIDKWLTKPKSLFGTSESRKFVSVDDPTLSLKWMLRRGITNYLGPQIRSWSCQTFSSSDSGDELCTFIPPNPNITRPELSLTAEGAKFVQELVMSCIILGAGKDEWKLAQSRDDFPSVVIGNPLLRNNQDDERTPSRSHARSGRQRNSYQNSSHPHRQHARQSLSFGQPPAPSYGSWMADTTSIPPPAYASTISVATPVPSSAS